MIFCVLFSQAGPSRGQGCAQNYNEQPGGKCASPQPTWRSNKPIMLSDFSYGGSAYENTYYQNTTRYPPKVTFLEVF